MLSNILEIFVLNPSHKAAGVEHALAVVVYKGNPDNIDTVQSVEDVQLGNVLTF